MVPRSKQGRLFLTERIVKAGLEMIEVAEASAKMPLDRAVGVRNGLIMALLALHPIRIKNFAALRIGDTFVKVGHRWWLHTPSQDTKTGGIDERKAPAFMTERVNNYIEGHRRLLCRGRTEDRGLWIAATTARSFAVGDLGNLISKVARRSLGTAVSPHLFRAAGASTAAIYAPGRVAR
jgi:hypothetical protein